MATMRTVCIYSNDGSELLHSLGADPNESITIESNGFTAYYGNYIYSGNKKFIGLATSANATTPTYAVGDTFTLGTTYMSYTFYIVEESIPEYTLRIDGVEVTDYENVIVNGVSYKCKGKTLISFTIASTTYQAEEGMTWAEWVSSSYNTGGFKVSSNTIINSSGSGLVNSSSVAVYYTDVIVANATYRVNASGGA